VQILDFEKEIFKVEKQIKDLTLQTHMIDSVGDVSHEIGKLKKKLRHMKRDIFAGLNGWQRTMVARHPDRPYTLDYIKFIFTDFFELHGDRRGGYGPSIVGGLAKLDGRSVMVIGHQKGREMEEKIQRNFGMSQPGGYRKALRQMKFAEKFGIPVIALIDTPGAYPGVDAEEKGQSEAIAYNLFCMADLRVPIISVIVGEGGSGGALAIGMGNRVLMLENSVYSVISPEGCASILWGDKSKVEHAAKALCMTAEELIKLKIIDMVVREPIGGAHRHPKQAAIQLKKVLKKSLDELAQMSTEEIIQNRQEKFRNMGEFLQES
jgi:acetyl-CoA carboxylase carboxyl transferase subunit alpha